MRFCKLVLCLSIAGCAADGGVGDDGGDDAPPPPPCDLGGFTQGVSTLAGCSERAHFDGTRELARFNNPVNVAVRGGIVYVADFDNHRVRAVTADGTTSTLVFQEDFRKPFGLAFSPSGTLYVQTDDNPELQHSTTTGTIWAVDLADGAAIPIVRDVGRPRGMLVLSDGRLVLSDYMHHVIRVLDPDGGAMAVLAGQVDAPGAQNGVGAAARFDGPYGIADLGDGSIAVAEAGGNRIRRVVLADGATTTLAGSGAAGNADGPVASASFRQPQDVATDGSGTIYVADTGNFVIRRISGEMVETIIGNGMPGYLDSDDRLASQIYGLEGIDFGDGKLFVADGSRGEDPPHHRIRISTVP
jgi:sugar lactone lactonase YvrE